MKSKTRRRTSAGFALPVAIGGLTLLLIIASTGFTISWMELASVHSGNAGTRAYHAADAGLAVALASPGRPTATSRTVVLTSGVANITYRPLLDLPGRGAIYEIRSTGSVDRMGTPFRRTVKRAVWVGDPPAADAALSVAGAGGVSSSGATGYVTGVFPPGCTLRSGTGIASDGPVQTGAVTVWGSPPIRASPPSVPSRTGLRWGDVTSNATPAPQATVPPDPWPPAGSGWPVVRLTAPGPLGPGHSGQGVIVATGDLDIADGFSWAGLILVGGRLRLFGDTTLRGAAFAGLDTTRVGSVDLGAGVVGLTFDPCAADAAAASIAPFPAVLPGTWREAM